jgi:hypothetical protein
VPIPYEDVPRASSAKTQANPINEREAGQAANLVERIFKRDPKARVFIYCGFSHLKKQAQSRTGDPNVTLEWMARRLHALTGIEPLTVDQTAMTEPESGTLAAAALARVFAQRDLADDSVVLSNESGGHLVLGSYKGDADMQVWHAPTRWVQGRPHWLAAGGHRKPQPVPSELMPTTGMRLVQAFRIGEGEEAVAVDQIIVRAGQEPAVFMLPDGEHRFAVED